MSPSSSKEFCPVVLPASEAQQQQQSNNKCGICLGKLTNHVRLPCDHSFCAECLDGWRPKYAVSAEQLDRKCPLCRQKIPPFKEMKVRLNVLRMMKQQCEASGDTSSQVYTRNAACLKRFEKEIGSNWDGTVLKDNEVFEVLPECIARAAFQNHIKRVLRWIKPGGDDQNRVNAKAEMNHCSFDIAALKGHCILASTLLQLEANVNTKDSFGKTPLDNMTRSRSLDTKFVRLLLEWGGEIEGPRHCTLASLLQSELGGRRCKINNMTSRADLNGKTCVADEYLPNTDQYKVIVESSKEMLMIDAENLEQRDHTPEDCGYFIEFKNGRTVRHNFAFKEDCRTFLTSFDGENSRPAVVSAEKDARAADQAAAKLLAELGIEEGEEVKAKVSTPKTDKSSKKKKNKGKKKRK